MKEQLLHFIEELKANGLVSSFDEAATKQAIVLRLLSILGWNTFNIEEVKPEYSVGGKSVDYALRIKGVSKVFVEVKRIGEDLERHQEQLLSYSFQQGVKLAVLTNGITWWFYLPLYEGKWEQRKYYTIDILEQESHELVTRFEDFLSKESVGSERAVINAETIYNSQKKQTVIRETLPKAWNKMISETDELLVDLIMETTESLCGYRPEKEVVGQFLERYLDQVLISAEPERLVAIGPEVAPSLASEMARDYQRTADGDKTPHQEFRIPILEALVEAGGRAKSAKVLDRVGARMKAILKPTDYQKLPSGIMVRWYNTAHWERLVMVRDGLLRKNSPKGLWEITDQGRKYLENHKRR